MKKLIQAVLAVTFVTAASSATAIEFGDLFKLTKNQQSAVKCTPYPDCALIIAKPTNPLLQAKRPELDEKNTKDKKQQ